MIRIHGELWGAVSSRPAPEGSAVRVLRIEGLKLYVEPAQTPVAGNS
jgi:membrane protein implicated in regulation of membrane protease activity